MDPHSGHNLCLDGILATEHIIDVGQIVSTGEEVVGVTSGLEVLLQVSMLTKEAESIVLRGRNNATRFKTVAEVKVLGHNRSVADDFEAEHGAGKTTAVAENGNSLGLGGVKSDICDKTDQSSVDAGSVHVTALSGNLNGGLDALIEALLGQTHESLFHSLVAQRLFIVNFGNLGGDLSKGGVRGVDEVIVVKHARIRLGHELAVGGMEQNMIKAVQRCLLLGNDAVDAELLLQGLLASIISLVALIDSLGVALVGEVAIDVGIFAGQVGLVEIVDVAEVAGTETRLEHNRSIGTDNHSDTSSSTGRTGSSLGVQSNITADDDGITAIPSRRLNPVDAVEDGVGASVASIDCVDTLDVGVAGFFEELHKNGLDRLGLVQESLGSDF